MVNFPSSSTFFSNFSFPDTLVYPSVVVYPTPSTFHADTLNWRDRAIATGGLIEDIDLLAINPFVEGVYNLGLRDSAGLNHTIIELLPFAGNNLAASLTKLWYPLSGISWISNTNFLEEHYLRTRGLQGNGTTNLKTNLNPFVVLQTNSVSIGVYNRTNGSTNTSDIATGGSTARLLMHVCFTDGNCYFDSGNITSGRTSVFMGGNSLGFILGNRIGLNDARIYKRGIELVKSTGSGGSLPNTELGYFVPSTRALGLIIVGLGIPHNLVASLNTFIQNMMIALGRAV